MAELILYAIPAFVLLLVVELLSFKYARDDDLVGFHHSSEHYNLSTALRQTRPSAPATG